MILTVRLILLTLVLGSLVHIFAVLSTPFLAEDKVWQRITAAVPARRMVPLATTRQAAALLGEADPAMAHAICHLSLDDGPAMVLADGPTSFWNVTIYNKRAEALYSLHDGVSETPLLNLTIHKVNQVSQSEEPYLEREPEREPDSLPSRVVDGLPLPLPRDITSPDEQEAVDDTIEDDNQSVDVRLNEDEIFLVFRIFKSSRHYDEIVAEALQTAECH